VDRLDLDAKAYKALRNKRFAEYKQTADYARQIQQLKDDAGSSSFSNDDFLYEYAVEEYMSVGDK
jgi:hypothetical protein